MVKGSSVLYQILVSTLLLLYIGLPVSSAQQSKNTSREFEPNDPERAQLLKVGIALYSFHEKYASFPLADGMPSHGANKAIIGLSWRVHILPFLREKKLYDKFKLNESWDSPNNLKLIREMPKVFRSNRVKAEGHTSLHVVLGDEMNMTAFQNPSIRNNSIAPKGVSISEMTDGTGNIIFAALAPSGTACQWTKPGGLVLDPNNPKAMFGDISDPMPTLFADAAIHKLYLDKMSDSLLLNLLLIQDGNVADVTEHIRSISRQKALESQLLTNPDAFELLQLLKISEAFFAFYDKHQRFPLADGIQSSDEGDKKLGLSWRVHLLPFLGEAKLYAKFRIDEPWDSEHNHGLINDMPDVFKTRGVTNAGQTCHHVIIGKPSEPGSEVRPIFFESNKSTSPRATTFRDITDGSRDTILTVIASLETADFWTKPGGLNLNVESSKATLGESKERLLALLADGTPRPINMKLIDDQFFLGLVTMNGDEPLSEWQMKFDKGLSK